MFMSCFWEVSVSSVLSRLLGCRRRSKKNNQGSHPVSPRPHLHCISNYCSQTKIKHQVELQSQGTWMGGGLKREVGVFLVKEGAMEGWKEGGIWELVSICIFPLEGRPDRVLKPGSRGLCRFNDLFPRDQILHLNYH